MKHFKKILLVLMVCVFTFAFAQNPRHMEKHQEYIASIQKPKIHNDLSNKFTNQILSEENEEITISDVDFLHGWENPRVNCYTDVDVPQTAKLDVSEFHMPVNGKMTSGYGYRPRFRRMHRGVDLSLNTGDTVRAAFSGKIRIVNYEGGGYGNYVVIRHDNGMETVYGHFSKHIVKKDQFVKAGQPIGLGGSTGRSTGPHLHFEIRYLGLALDPSKIVDFNEGVAHQDIYTFNKRTYQGYSTAHIAKKVSPKKKSYTNTKKNFSANYSKKKKKS